MPPIISTADVKAHLRVYHNEDDSYLANLVTAVTQEWEDITHQSIGASIVPANPSQRYTEAPDDGVYRTYFNPVDTQFNPIIICDNTPASPITPTEEWQQLDGATIYPVGTSLTSNVDYTFPLYFTYNTYSALNGIIKQALLLRIGYFYSYRGDDAQPPDSKGWLMLAARYRTGALL